MKQQPAGHSRPDTSDRLCPAGINTRSAHEISGSPLCLSLTNRKKRMTDIENSANHCIILFRHLRKDTEPGPAQFQRVQVPPRVSTARCSEPKADASNGGADGSGVAKPSLRTETGYKAKRRVRLRDKPKPIGNASCQAFGRGGCTQPSGAPTILCSPSA